MHLPAFPSMTLLWLALGISCASAGSGAQPVHPAVPQVAVEPPVQPISAGELASSPAPQADPAPERKCSARGVWNDSEPPGAGSETLPGDGRSLSRIVISDGESNSNQNNLGGYWFTYADQAGSSIEPVSGALGGVFSMSPGGANGTQYAARMAGKVGKGEIVYAGMGLNFRDPKGKYDASACSGLSFYARRSADSTPVVRLKVPDAKTDPDGGSCSTCFNDFGADLSLDTQWCHFVIPFETLTQLRGWGTVQPSHVDRAAVYGLQFQVSEPGARFDIWVDQIEFVGCKNPT